MPKPQAMLDLYLHLAKASEQQGRPLQRDKFLVLAASIAQKAGYSQVAAECRRLVLKHNPNHILKHYPTMAEALASDEIRHFMRQLLRIYPFEKAEYLLDKFRASGYTEKHGFLVVSKRESETPSDPEPSPISEPPPVPLAYETNGHGDDEGEGEPRPVLKKALANSKRRSGKRRKKRAPDPLLEPLPLELPYATQEVTLSRSALITWVAFALFVGAAAGAAAAIFYSQSG